MHSPALTVRESLQFSAECRLLIDDQKQLQEFVDEVSLPLLLSCCPCSLSWCIGFIGNWGAAPGSLQLYTSCTPSFLLQTRSIDE